MYPFSEFDLPEDVKERLKGGADKSDDACTTALAPRCLGGLLEELLLGERESSRNNQRKVQEPAAR